MSERRVLCRKSVLCVIESPNVSGDDYALLFSS
jgi:hypothetical protein